MWLTICSYIVLSYSAVINEMTQWVESQFTEEPHEIYIFEGELADHIPFVMVLGRLETEVIGTYRYQSKNDPYYLYGDLSNEKISLVESSPGGQTTGHMFASLIDGDLDGQWTNYSNDQSFPLRASEIDDVLDWDWPKSNDWIKQFYGQFSGRNVELLLQKEHELIRGTLFSANKKQSYFVDGSCTSDSCKQVLLEVFDDHQNYIGDLSGQFFQENVIFVNYQPLDAPSAFYSLPIRKEVIIEALPKVTYQVIQDFSYPQMSGFTEVVQSFYRSKSSLDTVAFISPDPPNRLSTIQSGWMDFHWMNSRVVSVSLIYQDNVQDTFYTELVNYDIKKQEIINVEDLFKRKSKYEQIISKYLKQRLKSCDYSPCSEIDENDFKHIGLMKEGFLLATDFDIVHGQVKWIIPYSHFDHELSKGTVMSFYYKPN